LPTGLCCADSSHGTLAYLNTTCTAIAYYPSKNEEATEDNHIIIKSHCSEGQCSLEVKFTFTSSREENISRDFYSSSVENSEATVQCCSYWIKSFSLDSNMATKLPSQEEFENWTAFQVAELLRQFGMPESAVVVEKLGMNGSHFLLGPTVHEKKFLLLTFLIDLQSYQLSSFPSFSAVEVHS
ncbi:hypothetical protein Q9966_006707, partial [Columba livia]